MSRPLVTYNLPLTVDDPTKAVLILPADLTREEAARIQQFLAVLADAFNGDAHV